MFIGFRIRLPWIGFQAWDVEMPCHKARYSRASNVNNVVRPLMTSLHINIKYNKFHPKFIRRDNALFRAAVDMFLFQVLFTCSDLRLVKKEPRWLEMRQFVNEIQRVLVSFTSFSLVKI